MKFISNLFKPKIKKTFVNNKLGVFILISSTKKSSVWLNNSSIISFTVRGSDDVPNNEHINFLLNFSDEVLKLQDKITKKFKTKFKEVDLDTSFRNWNERFKITDVDVMMYFNNETYWNITFQDINKPYKKFTIYIEGQKFPNFAFHP